MTSKTISHMLHDMEYLTTFTINSSPMESFVRSFMIEPMCHCHCHEAIGGFTFSAAEMFSDYLQEADDASDASTASMLEEVSQCLVIPL